jgi:hypothetical protein
MVFCFTSIAHGQVIDNASKVVDAAKSLWRSDSKKSNVDEFDISEGKTIYTSILWIAFVPFVGSCEALKVRTWTSPNFGRFNM